MKGLLIKDLRLMLQQKRFFLILFFIAIALNFNSDGGTFVVAYLTFLCSSFVLSTITYDEYENGYLFLMTLPASKKTFATEKYVFGLLLGSCAWATGVIISLLYTFLRKGTISLFDFSVEVIILIPVFAVFLSLILPFQFKFGNEKGKTAMFLAFAVAFIAAILCFKGLKAVGLDIEYILDTLPAMRLALIDLLIFAVAAAAVFISCSISRHIMQNKEL